MTLTIFIALCLLGCGFMLYVLLHWVRDTPSKKATGGCEDREQDRKQLHIVSSGKTNRNKVNAPAATDCQLVDRGNGRSGSSQASTIQSGLPTSESLDL
jgi:hypothetical protein